MSITGLLLGLINIAIVVAVLILVGLVIVFAGWMGLGIPEQLRKVYMIIVALIALYMIVALLLGIGSPFRLIGHAATIIGSVA